MENKQRENRQGWELNWLSVKNLLQEQRVTFVPPTSITLHTLYGALKSHYQADENACIQEHGIIFQSMDQVKKCDGHQLLNEHGDHH